MNVICLQTHPAIDHLVLLVNRHVILKRMNRFWTEDKSKLITEKIPSAMMCAANRFQGEYEIWN